MLPVRPMGGIGAPLGAVVFLGTLWVYIRTIHRSVAGGDSGELIYSSMALAPAHPPGYPLLLMALSLFTGRGADESAAQDPEYFSTAALWANVINACFASGAALFVYLGCCELLMRGEGWGQADSHRNPIESSSSSSSSPRATAAKSEPIDWQGGPLERPVTTDAAACAAAAAFVFALSPLVWTYATHCEVFALNNLLAAVALHRAALLASAHARLRQLGAGDADQPPLAGESTVGTSETKNKKRSGSGDDGSKGVSGGDTSTATSHHNAWADPRSTVLHHACVGAFLCGLGASNQHTLALYLIPLSFATLYACRSVLLVPRALAWLVMSLVAGSLPIIVFMPYLSSLRSPQGWGDCTTPGGLIHHLLRRDYGTLSLAPSSSDLVGMSDYSAFQAAGAYFASLANIELGWTLTAIAGLGVVVSVTSRRFRPLGPGLAVLLAVYLTLFSALQNLPLHSKLHAGIVSRFYMQPNLAVCIFLSVGLRCLSVALRAIASDPGLKTDNGNGNNDGNTVNDKKGGALRFSTDPRVVFRLCLVCLVAAHAMPSMPQRYAAHRESLAVRDYARAILRPLPRDALLVTKGDLNVNAVRYVQLAEGFRRDVVHFDLSLASYPWYVADPRLTVPGRRTSKGKRSRKHTGRFGSDYGLRDLLEYNVLGAGGASKRKAFVIGGTRPHWSLEAMLGDPTLARMPPGEMRGMWDSFPYGLTDYIFHVPEGVKAAHDIPSVTSSALSAIPTPTQLGVPDIGILGEDSWEFVIASTVTQCYHRLAWHLHLISGRAEDPKVASTAGRAAFEVLTLMLARGGDPNRHPLPATSLQNALSLDTLGHSGGSPIAQHLRKMFRREFEAAREREERAEAMGQWTGVEATPEERRRLDAQGARHGGEL